VSHRLLHCESAPGQQTNAQRQEIEGKVGIWKVLVPQRLIVTYVDHRQQKETKNILLFVITRENLP
jgi:hypothetical protein